MAVSFPHSCQVPDKIIGEKIKTIPSFRELWNDNQNESTEYISDLENENYIRVFSPISQLDGNNDILEQEIDMVSGSKTRDGKRVCISPNRYIFWMKLEKIARVIVT